MYQTTQMMRKELGKRKASDDNSSKKEGGWGGQRKYDHDHRFNWLSFVASIGPD